MKPKYCTILFLASAGLSQAAITPLTDGGFGTIDGATGRVDDIAAPWFESGTGAAYDDYYLDPSTDSTGFGPQFPGWVGGGLAVLETSPHFLYQSIGTADAATSKAQVDWTHIKRTVSHARGLVVSIYSSAAPLTGADGSSLASLGGTLVGSVDVTAASMGFTVDTSTYETKAGQALIDISSVTAGHSLYLELTGNADNTQGAFLDDVSVTIVAATQPVLSDVMVGSITSTGAQADVTLENSNADVTLFWDTADQGTGTWTNSNPLGAQVVGQVTGAITGLSADTRYFYRFYAVNTTPDPDLDTWSGAGKSFATALTGKSVSDLSATLFTTLEIDLEWTDNFDTETGFIIQRSLDASGPWTTVGTAPADEEFHTDAGTGLVAGTTYYYRIMATNEAGDSDSSNVANETTGAATPITTQVLVHFDGSVAGTVYTLGAGEIDTTASFKANGSPSVTGGTATINPGNGGGSDGFDFDPLFLGDLVTQNWVAEAVISFESFAGLISTVLDVQGDSEFRIASSGDMLEVMYWNGSTSGIQTTSLPTLGTSVHLALVWDASSYTMTGYVNGTSIGPVSQGAFSVSDATSVAFGYFGRTGFDNRGVDGVLDAVAFSSGFVPFDPGSDFRILPAGTSFATWIGGFGLDPADQGFNDDPDGDDLGNGLEGFFGTDPSVWNAGLAQTSTDGTTTTFTHPQAAPPLNDVTGSYQWSLDLVTWYAGDGVDGPGGGPTVTIPTVTPVGGTATVTATASAPVARLFVRAVATN